MSADVILPRLEIELTEQDRLVLIHTLTGSNERGVYRNWFAANATHHFMESLIRLTDAGLMTCGRKYCDGNYYHCTDAGAAAVGLHLAGHETR